uniref:Uncharacterized protein n=1 Tax=Glossina austeni TaxID=7395 RepID=A0A1A9URM3_GLOAU
MKANATLHTDSIDFVVKSRFSMHICMYMSILQHLSRFFENEKCFFKLINKLVVSRFNDSCILFRLKLMREYLERHSLPHNYHLCMIRTIQCNDECTRITYSLSSAIENR